MGAESLVDDWRGIPRIGSDYSPILVCYFLLFIVARRYQVGPGSGTGGSSGTGPDAIDGDLRSARTGYR